MTAPDVRQMDATQDDGAVMLSKSHYQELHGKSASTMDRALREGRVPGAVRSETGRKEWWIPADAVIAPEPVNGGVLVRQAPTGVAVTGVRRTSGGSRLGDLLTLEEAAAELGTDRAGVRRMATDGLLQVGRYGPMPGRALRVYVPPQH